MTAFHFEENLPHQSRAVENTLAVFSALDVTLPQGANSRYINPLLSADAHDYERALRMVRDSSGIKDGEIRSSGSGKNIIDIMMETGTGKTYTYTKTMFELNKKCGICKFIIVVPTLSIKAGTVSFLQSDDARRHFSEQYHKTLELHIVGSAKKAKKPSMPHAVRSFVQAGRYEEDKIQALIINAGMINSETMRKQFDAGLFDEYAVPMQALAATKPVMIIDEPHKFSQSKKTWKNIEQMKAQYILRYGATFSEGCQNLIYSLTSVSAFNQNLVKGVITHITEFEEGKNTLVKFVSSSGAEAGFERTQGGKKKTFALTAKQSLEIIHSEMAGLRIEKLNRSEVMLSNGLCLKRGDKLNPYSYAGTVQDLMIKKAVREHFNLERQLLVGRARIKPLTLFFIDNIEEYRGENGALRRTVEQCIAHEARQRLAEETDDFYAAYLQATLADVAATHGGYFSRDNSEKDEAIEKEVSEILHDKQAMLALDNPRRFIFSKWTLREGWDNPNVFQICKLRGSGSDTSKLQEVGRGLRLPVNEYGNRVKDEQFYLNYFVDFTEKDFAERLIREINDRSGAFSREDKPEKLTPEMIDKICELYDITAEALLERLDAAGVITRANAFKNAGFEYIKEHYPSIFDGVGSNKVRSATERKKRVTVRAEKYAELKALWERISEKVILRYKIDSEEKFRALFAKFVETQPFKEAKLRALKRKMKVEDGHALLLEPETSIYGQQPMVTMPYSDFLYQAAKDLHVNVKTAHAALESADDINRFLSRQSLRQMKQEFAQYLMRESMSELRIEYQNVSSTIHPTALTDAQGNARRTLSPAAVGRDFSAEGVSRKYLFEELFYDSALEKDNIAESIEEVVVFTKIPSRSIKIPVAGGGTYSPDFAYVVKYRNNTSKLFFIVVETKGVMPEDLRKEEKQKIAHAKSFFSRQDFEVRFVTQFHGDNMADLIRQTLNGEDSLNS